MTTTPADPLSSIENAPSALESQLRSLVFEAAQLPLVPAGSSGCPHGPWDPRQCALVLARWLDADLVVLLESTTTQRGSQAVSEIRQLTYDQARSLLADPESWSREGAPGASVSLMYNGARALAADDAVWWSAARTSHQAGA